MESIGFDTAGPVETVLAGHRAPFAIDVLICDRTVLPQLAAGQTEDEVARAVQAHGGAAPPQPDPAGVGSGGDEKVVFEAAAAPVIVHVDARINARGPHPAMSRHVCSPTARVTS